MELGGEVEVSDRACTCGALIVQPKRGSRRKFCTSCRPARLDLRRRTYKKVTPAIVSCVVCSQEFTAGNRLAKYCSGKCKHSARVKVRCRECGGDTGVPVGDSRASGICRPCGRESAEHGTEKMYKKFKCRCDACREAHNAAYREYAAKYKKLNGQSLYNQYRDPDKKLIYSDRRRAQKLAAFVEDVDRQLVFERESYRCYLCHGECLPGAPNNHPRQPTLDHVIPLVADGKHAYFNTHTACRLCNSTKGDTVVNGDQLLRIGG